MTHHRNYRPQRSGKVLFLHLSVIPFRGKGYLADAHTPQADPPQQTATAADGTHHTGMYSCCHCQRLTKICPEASVDSKRKHTTFTYGKNNQLQDSRFIIHVNR